MTALYDLMFLNTTTAIRVQANATDTTIEVDSTTGMAAEQAVTIVLDDASVHLSLITSVTDADTIVIRDAIPTGRHADVDAVVKSYYGYMCRKLPDSREKDFKVVDSPLLPEIMITGEASYTNISPEKEIRMIQDDWRKGFQDLMLSDAYKYFDSENCDMRFKGLGILSHKILSALSFGSALSPTPSLTDGGIESWTTNTPNYWTETGYGVSDETTIVHGGSHSATHTHSAGGAESGSIYQDISWNAAYQGEVFAFTAWVRRSYSGNTITITIDDGVGTTSQSMTAAVDTWQQIGVMRKLDASATRLRIQVSYYDPTTYQHIYIDDIALYHRDSGSFGAPIEQLTFAGETVCAMGEAVFAINGSITPLAVFPSTVTDICVFQNRLFVAQGWSDSYWHSAEGDPTAFYLCLLSNSTAKFISNVGDSQIWIADTAYTMRDSADGISSAFSTAYTVGTSAFDITGLVDHAETVFCRKEDDVYYLSGSDVLSLLYLESEASTTYIHKLYRWGDYLFVPSGLNSLYLYEISTGTAMVISPTRYAVGDANYDGQVLSLCFDETYAYLALLNGTNIRILSGRLENVEGDTDWWWHPIYSQTMNDVTTMIVSSMSGYKRMYVGTDTYSDGIIPFKVSVSYSAVYLESDFECVTSGDIITSWIQTGFPTDDKAWASIDVTNICKSSDATSITVYYQKKGDSGWTSLGSCTQSAGAGYPAEVTDNFPIGVTSERIRFKFSLATTNDDYTPILYGIGGGIVVHSVLQTERKLQIESILNIESQITIRDRTVRSRTVATDLTNLRAIYRGGEQQTVIAPDETEYEAVIAREGYEEQLAYSEAGERSEIWWVTMKLLEV